MTDSRPPGNSHTILQAHIGWSAFVAVAVLCGLLVVSVAILIQASFGSFAPFIIGGVGAALWVFVMPRYISPKRAIWIDRTKPGADLIWNIWSWFGALLIFLFLMEARPQINAASKASNLIEDLNGVLQTLEPWALTALFTVVYTAACVRVFLPLSDFLKKKTAPSSR